MCILYVRTFSSRSNITTPFSFKETLYYTSSHDDEKEDAASFFFFFAGLGFWGLGFEGTSTLYDLLLLSPKFFCSRRVSS
jgi:hypothetical protein